MEKNSENLSSLEIEYRARFESTLIPLATALQTHLIELLAGQVRIDRISARAKSVDRFIAKARAQKDGGPKYSDPLSQIQDQIGARVVVFYPQDVTRVSAVVDRYYRAIESQEVVPDSQWKFGYFGTHFIFLVPTDLIPQAVPSVPEFFELQIKTLFQHAWSEANHDLGYKPGATPLGGNDERLLALASAQAWGSDRVFEELFAKREGS